MSFKFLWSLFLFFNVKKLEATNGLSRFFINNQKFSAFIKISKKYILDNCNIHNISEINYEYFLNQCVNTNNYYYKNKVCYNDKCNYIIEKFKSLYPIYKSNHMKSFSSAYFLIVMLIIFFPIIVFIIFLNKRIVKIKKN